MPVCCEVFDYDIDKKASLARLFWLPAMRGKSGRSMGISACWWI